MALLLLERVKPDSKRIESAENSQFVEEMVFELESKGAERVPGKDSCAEKGSHKRANPESELFPAHSE